MSVNPGYLLAHFIIIRLSLENLLFCGDEFIVSCGMTSALHYFAARIRVEPQDSIALPRQGVRGSVLVELFHVVNVEGCNLQR